MNRNSIFKSRWLQTTAGLCTAVVLYLFLSHIDVLLGILGSCWRFISPVVTGIIMAYVMSPLSNIFEEHVFKNAIKIDKTRHQVSVFCTIAIVLLVAALLMVVLIPQLVRSVAYLVGHIGVYSAQLQGLINRIAGETTFKNLPISRITSIFNEVLQKITSGIIGNYDSVVAASVSIGRQVVNIFIAIILAVYFLMDKAKLIDGLKRMAHAVMDERSFNMSVDFLERCHKILVRYIAFDLIDGLVIAFINYVFMKIVGMSYAGLVSIVVGVTNLAPTFGPIVGCLIGAFILLLTNPVHALFFLIFTVVLQIFDGYFFKPRLFGQEFGVSPLWILIFIILGGRIFGVMGILIAIPLAAIFNFIYDEMIIVQLERRKSMRKNDAEMNENTVEPMGSTVEQVNEVRIPNGQRRFE